jgi:CarD family transcriptional regulator
MSPTAKSKKIAKKSKTAKTAKKTAPARTAGKPKPAAARPTGAPGTARKAPAAGLSARAAKTAKAAAAKAAVPKPPARPARIPRSKLRYKKNQQIVYPLQGVGKVVTIEERPFRATRLLYYIIYLEVSDMTVMVPVERADELGIRPIVDKRESQKALKLISEDYEPIPADWKLRYQMNLDLLKKGSVLDIATVVRALYHRSRIKELPILERKLYDNALRLLVDEISFSLDKSKTEVEELVMSKLEQN